ASRVAIRTVSRESVSPRCSKQQSAAAPGVGGTELLRDNVSGATFETMKANAELHVDWDGLIKDPARFKTLSIELQDTLYLQVAQLEAVCRAVVLTRTTPNGIAPASDPDQVVRLPEAASRLGMSKDFLHRSWRKLGGFKDDDGHVKFSLRVIARHVQSREHR